jgi:hypothetical protein
MAPRTPPPHFVRSPSPANAGEDDSAARLPPPATRERVPATRLATHMFYFCSYSRESGIRVKAATRRVVGQFEKLDFLAQFGRKEIALYAGCISHRDLHMTLIVKAAAGVNQIPLSEHAAHCIERG